MKPLESRLTVCNLKGIGLALLLIYAVEIVIFCQAMGHEPDFNRFGPGSLIEKENMLKAHDSGFRYYDFGSGYEPYKFQWYTDIDFTRKFIMSTKGTTEGFIRSWMVLRDRVKGKLTNNHQLVKLKRDRLGGIVVFF
ncbi:GNAT family N-acetyltransferase [Lysinibacillus sp. MHQ-1]|nr:GNAT family N-acetyltransferase [Lysinibacillus sp. MHQ-1]